jgi:hypothetical protein
MSVIELGESIPALTPHVSLQRWNLPSFVSPRKILRFRILTPAGLKCLPSSMERQHWVWGGPRKSRQQDDNWLSTVCHNTIVHSLHLPCWLWSRDQASSYTSSLLHSRKTLSRSMASPKSRRCYFRPLGLLRDVWTSCIQENHQSLKVKSGSLT